MNKLYFWSHWTKPFRSFYILTLSFFALSLLFYLYSATAGKDLSLGWDISRDVFHAKVITDTFQKGYFEFAVDIDNQYLFQTYEGKPYQALPFASYLVIATISLLLISGPVMLSYVKDTSIVRIKELWYYAGLTFLGIFIYYLQLNVLEVFGLSNMYWPVAVFLLYGGLVHYFRKFRSETKIFIRYASFACLTALFFGISFLFSHVQEPVLHLAAYGWLAPFLLALLYIFLISADIYYVFLYIATNSRHAKTSSAFVNFLILSLIYLGNLVFTFLRNRKSIDWDMLYLEAPVILVICSLLGIWLHRKKEPVYEQIIDFSPVSAVWHLVLAINCFICYSFANLSGNDSLQEVFEDGVIFSQICTGLIFILFIAVNFVSFMAQNLPVHMVVYKPKYMPFGFVRIMGLIGICTIVLYNNGYQQRQAMAGYYINIADVYLKQDDQQLADEYLKSALGQDASGHKANYSLAMLVRSKDRAHVLVKSLLKEALFKKPSSQAYASLGAYFLQEKDIIRSLEILKEGNKLFPQSHEIANNLALAFSQTDINDSTLHYLALARKLESGSAVALSNELAFAIKNGLHPSIEPDKLSKDLIYQANYLVLLNQSKQKQKTEADTSILGDSVLTPEKVAYFSNLSFHLLKDTLQFKNKWLDTLIARHSESVFYDKLILAKAFRCYYQGKIAEAIVLLDRLQSTGFSVIPTNNVLAKWLIQQDAPQMATDFLLKAREAGDYKAGFGLAIATSYYLPGKQALSYWTNPVIIADSTYKYIALALLTEQPNLYTLGIIPQLFADTKKITSLFSTLPQSPDKVKATGRIMEHLIAVNLPEESLLLFEQQPETEDTRWQHLRAMRKLNKRNEIADLLKQPLTNNASLYLQAWSQEVNNEKIATELYLNALKSAPFYEDGILDALNFLKNRQNSQQMYDILLEKVMLNPYSIAIQQSYAMQCVQMNLFGFADYTVTKLKTMMQPAVFASFEKQVISAKEKQLKEVEWK